MKWVKSLQVKYLMIIFIAVMIIPFSVPVVSLLVFVPQIAMDDQKDTFEGFSQLEELWHEEAKKLADQSDPTISRHLHELHKKYPESQMFWVDRSGKTRETYGDLGDLPDKWTPSYTIQFMKQHYDADPFTVVAFLGGDSTNGFMVIKVDRTLLEPPIQRLDDRYSYLYMIIVIFILFLFIFLSWLFFKGIHKRLLRLTNAMQDRSELGIPHTIVISKLDEIGQLEKSFNQMITELEQSRKREQEEETLRKDLIANLSHDLRTPLTTIRAQLSIVKEEVKSIKGNEALASVDQKIDYLSALIDNLFSYTLLSAGKYPYHPVQTDLNRLIRKIAAQWYPVLEQQQFKIDIDTHQEPIYWTIDPQWMERLIENLLQNIIRHAAEGRYVGITLSKQGNGGQLLIQDKGNGFKEKSDKQGAGIGLTIVDLMVKEMGLTWSIESSEEGTVVKIVGP
ncbi:HAMP domain-containing sensor histidine kinase [Metabacillus bambusae]|uniref:histidine kinase n=1 Tax=Metabacillus bambusae TaxID=2795218 RepID=A0ABS3N0K8_9BACI|nr:HAMP domain-containing sensor histidine kinase [Metabacillus bambusae]MBO1511802.1 HAMP domain-containing histidine kinase [Metabacillus bambusae]